MGAKRYPFSSLEISGERCVGILRAAPWGMQVALGLAAIIVGAAFLIHPHHLSRFVMGAVFFIAGVFSLLFRAYFVLDPERRLWREVVTLAGIGKVNQGCFDDAIGIQIVPLEWHDNVSYQVVWRWRDERHRARLLESSRDYASARQKWLALGRELSVPLVELRGSELVVVAPEAVPLSHQSSPATRSFSILPITNPPAGSHIRLERSANSILLFLPLSNLAKQLWAMLAFAAIMWTIILVLFFLSFAGRTRQDYKAMLWLASPIVMAACLGVALQVMMQRIIELRDGEVRLRRRIGLGIFRPRRIPYSEISAIHCSPELERAGLFVLATASRGYNLGQGINQEGRNWLVDVLCRAMGAPERSSAAEGHSSLEATRGQSD